MRQRKYLACLTLILKIYKQNSKFVIQNNDNQKNVNEQVSNRKKNDRENNNNNRNGWIGGKIVQNLGYAIVLLKIQE